MLDAGFAPDVERILAMTPPTRQMALFTATLPEWTTEIARRYLHDPVRVDVGDPNTRPASAISQIVYLVPEAASPHGVGRRSIMSTSTGTSAPSSAPAA